MSGRVSIDPSRPYLVVPERSRDHQPPDHQPPDHRPSDLGPPPPPPTGDRQLDGEGDRETDGGDSD